MNALLAILAAIHNGRVQTLADFRDVVFGAATVTGEGAEATRLVVEVRIGQTDARFVIVGKTEVCGPFAILADGDGLPVAGAPTIWWPTPFAMAEAVGFAFPEA